MIWFLLALAIPILEIASLVVVGDLIGGPATLGLVVLAMVLGVFVVRAGIRRLRQAARAGSSATDRSRMVDPLTWTEPLVMIGAGVLLVIPGFVGDVIGLALLIPGVRLLLLGVIGSRLARRFPSANVTLTRLRIGGGGPVVPGETIDPPQP